MHPLKWKEWLVLWPTPWFCSTLSAQNLSMLNDPLFAKPTTYLCIWLFWCLFGWGGRVIWVHLRAIIMLKGLHWDGDVISHSLVGCLFDDKKINPEISHCLSSGIFEGFRLVITRIEFIIIGLALCSYCFAFFIALSQSNHMCISPRCLVGWKIHYYYYINKYNMHK